jgi:hypothetical protein
MKRETERLLWNALVLVMFVASCELGIFILHEEAPQSDAARELIVAINHLWAEVKKGIPKIETHIDTRLIEYDIPRAALVDKVLGTETRLFRLRRMSDCETEVLRAESGRHLVTLCEMVFITDDRTLKVLHIAPREMWEKNPELFLRLLKDPAGGQETTREGGKDGLH